MSPTEVLQELKQNEHLRNVPEAQLQWLIDHGECRTLAAGEAMFRKDDPLDHLQVLLAGCVRVYMVQGGQQIEFGRNEKGDIMGVLPYSRLRAATGNGDAVEDTTLLSLHRRHFPEMIRTQHELAETFVHLMLNRVRDFTKFQQQYEKMASLGKLSAGLAHELNNPAAAVVRSADALRKHLSNVPEKFKQIISMRLTSEQIDRVNDMLFSKLQAGVQGKLSMMERTAREDELTDWLDDHGVTNGFDMAETFVDYGIAPADLDFVNEQVDDAHLSPVLEWLNNVLTTEKMVSDISEASGRIANLVKAIKEYSHMDGGADRKPTALSEGIQSTLTILQHKLKAKHIHVKTEMADNLPLVSVNPGEMNQVWTNLIDNAIDALPDGGELRIEMETDREFVVTRVIDNGPGIPADIQSLIFDPFFTTKPVGQGTGLGLDIAQTIVRRHNGKIILDSRPGRTEFGVCLPV